eukprot:TRINITY_DN16649_c0_g1_i1.p1 TRINITY_DN16649_c0_g1~~TRINITY_DN16649_c0_g1_i1.p1  ORF type:complete len:775 (+),score=146.20 TRINITY_DN16649_c0_g1_i1:42-2366(+)
MSSSRTFVLVIILLSLVSFFHGQQDGPGATFVRTTPKNEGCIYGESVVAVVGDLEPGFLGGVGIVNRYHLTSVGAGVPMEYRYDPVLTREADFVVLAFGSNDIGPLQMEPKEFHDKLVDKINAFKLMKPRTAMLTVFVGVDDGGDKACYPPLQVKVFKRVAKLAAECNGVGYLSTLSGHGNCVTKPSMQDMTQCNDRILDIILKEADSSGRMDIYDNVPACVLKYKKPFCETAEDFRYPGPPESEYNPRHCILRRYSKQELMQCLGKGTFIGIGDSLVAQVVQTLSIKAGMPRPALANMLWNPSVSFQEWYLSKMKNDMFPFLTEKAGFAMVSMGMWEIGVHWCGPEAFYEGMKQRVLKYKSVMKPNTTLAIHNIHYINVDKHPFTKICNPPDKVKIFREIVETVSACTKVPLFDFYPLTKAAYNLTTDGVHYEPEIVSIKANLVLNNLCGIDKEGHKKLSLYVPHRECDEAAAKRRWASSVAAQPSETCHENKYMCREVDPITNKPVMTTPSDELRAISIDTSIRECKSLSEIYPGGLLSSNDDGMVSWVPTTCRLKKFDVGGMKACLDKRQLVLVGDILSQGIGRQLEDRLNYTVKSFAADEPAAAEGPNAFAVVSMTFDHIGPQFKGFPEYYDMAKAQVIRLQAALSNATLALHMPEHIQTAGFDGPSKTAKKCYPDAWVSLFRSTYTMLSACTGVGLLDFDQLIRNSVLYINGTGTYEPPILEGKASIIANVMCGGVSLTHPAEQCDEKKLKQLYADSASIVEDHVSKCT